MRLRVIGVAVYGNRVRKAGRGGGKMKGEGYFRNFIGVFKIGGGRRKTYPKSPNKRPKWFQHRLAPKQITHKHKTGLGFDQKKKKTGLGNWFFTGQR